MTDIEQTLTAYMAQERARSDMFQRIYKVLKESNQNGR